ncbi:MAG: DUF6785 family protein [Armatimonadota bacterium]
MSVDNLEKERLEKASTNEPTQWHGITPRAIIIGFLAIIPGVFWGVYGDIVSQTDLTSTSLMMPPVIILVFLMLVNLLLKYINPKWILKQSELITIYSMLTVSVILSGMGMIQFLVTTLGAVQYFSTPENEWGQYLNYVPSWILPDMSAVTGFYKGGEPIPWNAWIKPIIFWSAFLFSMLFSMVCINTIVRKQWIERERLAYPIAQLPMEMTDPKNPFFKNKLMWIGFFIAAAVETLNSISFLNPNVPSIQIRAYNIMPSVTSPPWDAFGSLTTTFYPLAIGLGFILSTDVSFSCWFFYFVMKFQNVFAAAIGWKSGAPGTVSSPPYLAQQGAGAFIGVFIVVIYLAKDHIRDVFRKAFKGCEDVDDSNEALSYKTAINGLIISFAVMLILCSLTGVSMAFAFAYLAIYLIFSLAITRMRAEAGPAWTMGPDNNALNTIIQPIGSSFFSKQSLISIAYFTWFSIEMRCNPMPTTAETMKMADVVRIKQRKLMFLLLLAIVAGIGIGFWACLSVYYTYGAGTAKVEPWRTYMGAAPFYIITNNLNNPTISDINGFLAMVFGACFTFLLTYIRTKLVWFPIHPAGYVLAGSGTLYWLWCPIFIAWLAKVIIIKYAGIKGYKTALPFFLGLVLGDYVTAGLWALAGSLLGQTMYRCFPC